MTKHREGMKQSELDQLTAVKQEQYELYSKFYNENEFMSQDIKMKKDELVTIRELHTKEVNIYIDKVAALKHENHIASMPFEDALAQQHRLECKVRKLELYIEDEEKDQRFLRKEYLKSLMFKNWSKMHKEKIEKLQQKQHEDMILQQAYIKKNQKQIDMLNSYKDDLERDNAQRGARVTELIKEVQITEGRIARKNQDINDLKHRIREMEDKYIYYPRSAKES